MTSHGLRDVETEANVGRTVESEFNYYAKWGHAYITTHLGENTSTGDTTTLHLQNPEGSGVTGVFSLLNSTPAAPSTAYVYDRFSSAPTGGTESDIMNVRMDTEGGAADVGELVANAGVTFTAESTHASRVLGGGQGSGSIGASANMPVFALEPGREIVLEVEKRTNDGDDVSITARWFEVPVVYSEWPPDPDVEEVTRGRGDY